MVRGCLPRPPKKLIRSSGSGGSFFANNCGGCSVMEFGSMGWSGCLRCLLGLRPFVGNGCTSVDGSFCSVVVPLGRRQISSDYVSRSTDGRHMDVAAAIETFVTNKAGDAGSSCKVEHFACACSWPRRSCRVSRGQDGRPKGKLLQASGRCHEQSTNNGGDVCNRTTVQIVGDSRFRLGSPNDRPAGACRHKGKTLISF